MNIIITITLLLVVSIFGNLKEASPKFYVNFNYGKGGVESELPNFNRVLNSKQFLQNERSSHYYALTETLYDPSSLKYFYDTEFERVATHEQSIQKYNFDLHGGISHPWLSFEIYRLYQSDTHDPIPSSMLFANENLYTNQNKKSISDSKRVQLGGVVYKEFVLNNKIALTIEAGLSKLISSGELHWYIETGEDEAFQKSIHSSIKIRLDRIELFFRGYGFFIDPKVFTFPERMYWTTSNEQDTVPSYTYERTKNIYGFEIKAAKMGNKKKRNPYSSFYEALLGFNVTSNEEEFPSVNGAQLILDSLGKGRSITNIYVQTGGVTRGGLGLRFTGNSQILNVSRGIPSSEYTYSNLDLRFTPQIHLHKILGSIQNSRVKLSKLILDATLGILYNTSNEDYDADVLDSLDYVTFQSSISGETLLKDFGINLGASLKGGMHSFGELSVTNYFGVLELYCSM